VLTTEDSVRDKLREHLQGKMTTQRAIAKDIGVSQAVLSMFMRSKYSGDSEGVWC